MTIQINDLEFRYAAGEFLLRIDELAVEAGEHLAVVGPSGSGKTTLLRLVAGIAVPAAGHVETCGVVVSDLNDAERRAFRSREIGLVFQEFELLEHLSVLDNVLLPFRISPGLRLENGNRERARELLDRVGIGDKLRRRPGELSQGERQRVAVCRALATRPKLLLADEPTGNLDPNNKRRVLEILLEFARDEDATLLTVTHDVDLLPHFGRVIDVSELAGLETAR